VDFSSSDANIVIAATVKGPSFGDIAIDDVILEEGDCSAFYSRSTKLQVVNSVCSIARPYLIFE